LEVNKLACLWVEKVFFDPKLSLKIASISFKPSITSDCNIENNDSNQICVNGIIKTKRIIELLLMTNLISFFLL